MVDTDPIRIRIQITGTIQCGGSESGGSEPFCQIWIRNYCFRSGSELVPVLLKQKFNEFTINKFNDILILFPFLAVWGFLVYQIQIWIRIFFLARAGSESKRYGSATLKQRLQIVHYGTWVAVKLADWRPRMYRRPRRAWISTWIIKLLRECSISFIQDKCWWSKNFQSIVNTGILLVDRTYFCP